MLKIGWFLCGDRNTPSSRIMGINVHKWMVANGVDSNIILPPFDELLNMDVVIFQKVMGDNYQNILIRCRQQHRKTIYILDDLYAEAIPMVMYSDVVVCGSEYIKDWVKHYTKAQLFVMPDAYETPRELCKKEYKIDKPKAVWFGTLLHLPQAVELKPVLQNLGYEYEIISAHQSCTKQWNLETIWEDIMNCDVVVLPYLGVLPPFELAKGNNRVTQSMVLGMPVVTSPVPAYLQIIENYKNGFVCHDNTAEQFQSYLETLKDCEYRESIGKRARKDVIDTYSIDVIGNLWKGLLESL